MISFFFSFDSEPATDQPLSFPNSFEDITGYSLNCMFSLKSSRSTRGGGGGGGIKSVRCYLNPPKKIKKYK